MTVNPFPPIPPIERALRLLRTIEGGFVNDPRDNGGATNHGISLREVKRLDKDGKLGEFLQLLDIDHDGDIDVDDVKGWTWDTAKEFYRRYYFDSLRLGEMPFPVALVIFDSGVNEGTGVAVRHFQRAMNLDDDGVVGPETLRASKRAAVNGNTLEAFLVDFAGLRLERYRKLDDAPTYFRGWSKRVVLVSLDALKEAA